MDKELRKDLIDYIAERLTKEIKHIKRMLTSTADDYGNNISYFHKMLDEEFDKVVNSNTMQNCPHCNGSGEVQQTDIDWDICGSCNGKGKIKIWKN